MLGHIAQDVKVVRHRFEGKDLGGETRQMKRVGSRIRADVLADVRRLHEGLEKRDVIFEVGPLTGGNLSSQPFAAQAECDLLGQ